VTPFETDITTYGTTMVRSIMAVKLDTHVLRTYEESIFYPMGPEGKVIRVVQNKTNNAPGMIGRQRIRPRLVGLGLGLDLGGLVDLGIFGVGVLGLPRREPCRVTWVGVGVG